ARSVNGDRAAVEALGVLLHPTHRVPDRHAVPVLLDAHYRHPSRRGAVPLVAGGQQHAVLDAESHAPALPRSVPQDDVSVLALENVLHRTCVDLFLPLLPPARPLPPPPP